MTDIADTTMTPERAAEVLGCSVAHVRKLLNSGVLHGIKRPTVDGRRSSRSHWIVFSDSVSRLLGRPCVSQASVALARVFLNDKRRTYNASAPAVYHHAGALATHIILCG